LIGIDAYRQPYIPWHMTTVEFFELTKEHLTGDGVLVINVGRSNNDRSLIDALVTTLAEVFPSIHVMDIPYTFNSMVYATMQTTTLDNLIKNYGELINQPDIHPLLVSAIERTAVNYQALPEPTIVFTDDKAPVEWVVNRMVLNYVFSGDYEELK
jgi:hypothetical protein